MNKRTIKKRRSIIVRIFIVIFLLALSINMFVWAIWGLLVSIPNRTNAHIHLALTFVILITVGILVASFVIRKILKPLSVLNDAVESVGKGNLDLIIPVNHSDEFGALADAINLMTADLKKMMQAREQLLLDVSHELRTPITRARLALEMMPDSAEKESIEGDIREMELLVTELLDSERLKSGSFKLNRSPVNVNSLLKSFMDNYHRERDRITLFPVSPDLVIDVDENLILTVLRNLVDNALKYSSGDSKPVEIQVVKNNENISINIEDFGEGIPEDKLPFIFEPFFRADQSRSRQTGGYGLGLHLCKRIMDLHNAEIRLQNKTGGKGIIASLNFKTDENLIHYGIS
jgi:signal transduction histidine kinase